MRKIISFLLILASLFCLLTSCDTDDEPIYYHTEDVADFNTGVYSIDKIKGFNYDLPEDAKIISHYYHEENYNSEYNVSLEIKCSSEDSVTSYIDRVKEESIKYMEDKHPNRIFNYHEEQNPYNSSFTDLFVPVTDRMNGYENIYDPDSESIFSRDEYDLTAFFACVSYSKEDFVVFISSVAIMTSIDGKESSYEIPRYFVYFNVPLDKEYQRFFVTSRPK